MIDFASPLSLSLLLLLLLPLSLSAKKKQFLLPQKSFVRVC